MIQINVVLMGSHVVASVDALHLHKVCRSSVTGTGHSEVKTASLHVPHRSYRGIRLMAVRCSFRALYESNSATRNGFVLVIAGNGFRNLQSCAACFAMCVIIGASTLRLIIGLRVAVFTSAILERCREYLIAVPGARIYIGRFTRIVPFQAL